MYTYVQRLLNMNLKSEPTNTIWDILKDANILEGQRSNNIGWIYS